MRGLGVLLLIDRLILATVFASAAAGKFADPQGARRAIAGFGAPKALEAPGAAVLPFIELAIAMALLPARSAWWASLGALLLLLLFLAAITFNLARGRRPDCHCFGQFHSEPIGPRTIVLNLALCAAAGLVILAGRANPGPDVLGWLAPMTLLERLVMACGVAALLALGLLGFLMWQMLLQQGRLLIRLERLETLLTGGRAAEPAPYQPAVGAGLPIGAPAPDFALPDANGEIHTLATLLAADVPLFLLFTSPSCGPCEALLPQIATWRAQIASPRVVLVAEGPPARYGAALAHDPRHPVLGREDRRTAEFFRVWGTPSAVLIEADGTIGARAAGGAEAITGLMAWIAGRSGGSNAFEVDPRSRAGDLAAARPILAVGAPAPSVVLRNLRGEAVDLATRPERKTMLLFWNPGCGFCQQMLADVQRLDAEPPADGPDIVVVSNGSTELGAAMNLRSTVLLDPEFKAGAAFGAGGTPMAILLDTDGKVASEIAAGASAVLRLAGA